MQAKKISDDLKGFIEDIKKELIKRGEGIDPKSGDIVRRDDQDVSTHYMMGEGNNGKAKELKAKILEARAKFLELVDPKERTLIEKSLNLNAIDPKGLSESGVTQTWEIENFEGVPLTAAVTLLTKMQADVENSEASVVDHLYKSIDSDVTIAVDQFKAVAVAPTSYLIVGQPYKAQVFLTAFDSHENPDVTVNGSRLQVKDGMGDYSVSTNKQGIFTWIGTIHIKDKDGKDKEYKTEPQTYQVSAPSAVVSADKMNVLYIGVPNPVSVSAPGVQLDKVHARLSAGSISGANGHYIAKVSEPGKAIFTVSGEVDGKERVLGTTEYRIKRIPDPIAKFGGIGSGRLSAGAIKAQAGVAAVLEGFDFDAHFEVVKFTMSVNKARQLDLFTDVSNGSGLTPSMKNALQGIGPRDRVSIDDIMVKGPDGAVRKLTNGITITAN
jgi:gliding motility-associated protein GldM